MYNYIFCDECCTEVECDDFGDPKCAQCNTQYNSKFETEEGVILPINFEDLDDE